MPTYQVKDWNKNFENAKSRQIERCSSVHLPNKAAGLGLSRVLAEKDGAAIFGIFVLIVEACSRHLRPRNGWLTRDGHPEATPWTLNDLEVIVHRPPLEIKRTLDVLSSPAVGWIAVSGECPPSDHAVSPGCPPGSHEVDPNELTKERKKELTKPHDEAPTITEVLKATNGPAFDKVDRTAILQTLTREEIPRDRLKEILGVVEDSLRTRRPPPQGVKDSPTGYALKIIRSKGEEIRDAAAADEAARRNQNVQHFNGADFTEEDKAELVEKYLKMFPGTAIVFDGPEVQPFEPDPTPTPERPAHTDPETPSPARGDGRPAPYHLLYEFPVLWKLDNRTSIIGALVELSPKDRLPALRLAMEKIKGVDHRERAKIVYQAVTGGFRKEGTEDEKDGTGTDHANETKEDANEKP